MDMKKILQAMDGVSSKPVEGSNDMKKFLSVVTEGANPHKVALPVQMAMQHYSKPVAKVEHKTSLLKKYFSETEERIASELAEEQELKSQRLKMYSQQIAERVLMKESAQGVAEGSGGNWYIRVNGKILNDTKFKPVIFSSEDEARSHAMKLADKKRIPLSQIKLTKSWMDAPEQGVAEDSTDLVQIEYWQQETIESGRWVKTKPIPRATAEKIVNSFERGEIVNVEQGVTEAPIDMTGDPNDPVVYGHEKANPMSLKGRIQQARAQLKELAQLAESDDLIAWEKITRLSKGGMFMGLEQNLEQIRHGISELAAKRKQGGVASRGIDKHIGEGKTK